MKRRLSVLMIFAVLLASFTGCTPEGEAFLDIYQKTTKIKTYEQMERAEIRINLQAIMKYFASSGMANDFVASDTYKKIVDELKVNPELVITIKGQNKSDVADVDNLKLQGDYKITINALGETYLLDNFELMIADKKIYISKNYIDFLIDSQMSLMKKFASKDVYTKFETGINNDDTFKMIRNLKEKYIMIDLYPSKDLTETDPIDASVMDREEVIKILNEVLADFKDMSVKIPVTVNGDAYTVNLTIEEVIDMLPELLETFAGLSVMADDKDNLLELAESIKTDDGQQQLNLAKNMLSGTKISLTLEELADGLKSELSMIICYLDDELISMTSSPTTKVVDSVTVTAPDAIDAFDIMGYIDEQSKAAEKAAAAEHEAYLKTPKSAIFKDQVVIIDGKKVEFDAYNIENHMYFKLRDLATSFNDTKLKMNVMYDDVSQTVKVNTNTAYDRAADGMTVAQDKSNKEAYISQQGIEIDDYPSYIEAFNIEGSNYFQLRDLGMSLDFYIGYNDQTQAITIDTTKSYDWNACE